MKILFFNYEYPPLGGGAANASKYILQEYSKMDDIEVDFVTSSVNDFRIEQVGNNVTIHFLDIGKKGNLHYQKNSDLLKYSWKAFWYARKLAKENKYDLIHAFFGIPCGFLAMFFNKPFVVSLRGTDVPFYNRRFLLLDLVAFRWLSKIIWRSASAVVSLSDDLIELARKTSKTQPISVIYNGINSKEFFPDYELLAKQENFNILFVGRLIGRKGLDFLLEAVKEIKDKYPQLKLHVAGDGPLMDFYKKYTKENNMEGCVVFHGNVHHDQIFKLYQTSHVFVLPSLNEALGNVTQEALASGMPIITTKTGAAELMHENGFVISKRSANEIKESLVKILENENLRQQMGRKSREIAEEMTWEKTAKSYVEVYRKILK